MELRKYGRVVAVGATLAGVLVWGAPAASAATDYLGATCTVLGTEGPDNLQSTAASDVICGLGGNDIITVGTAGGNDRVDGGSGDDTITTGAGNDFLRGGLGNDILNGGTGNDELRGSRGNDTLTGAGGTDTITYSNDVTGVTVNLGTNSAVGTLTGTDTLATVENVTTGFGNDTITGSSAVNVIDGGGGVNTINGVGLGNTCNNGPTFSNCANQNPLTAGTVSGHNTDADCWIIINGLVYDASTFGHPVPLTGEGACGADGTSGWNGQGHSAFAIGARNSLQVGVLV